MRQRHQIVEGEHIMVQLQVTGEQEGLPRPESHALVEIQLGLALHLRNKRDRLTQGGIRQVGIHGGV